MQSKPVLRLAVPSSGPLHEITLSFLRSCGLSVSRTNSRRYTAQIPTLAGMQVIFLRNSDVPPMVEEGSADMGIVGRDRFLEMRREGGSTDVVIAELGYGHCKLEMGVPDSWVDVTSLADLADVAMREFREKHTDLRVATKYPRLVGGFLLNNGISYFLLVQSSGALEVAPAMGYADVIADITSTGATMRENRLKSIGGGTIMESQACLIANKRTIVDGGEGLELGRTFVEFIEAHLESEGFYSVTANMRGETPEEVAGHLLGNPDVSGLRGPTISKVHTRDSEGWYAVTVIIEKSKLVSAVGSLRKMGGSSVTVSQPSYVFDSDSTALDKLL